MKPTEEEYVRKWLDYYKKEAKALGFPLSEKQKQYLHEEYKRKLEREETLRLPHESSLAETRKYWVIVDKPGDSYFTEGSAIPYEEFEEERKKILDRGGKPPTIRIRLEEPPENGVGEYQPSVIDLDALAATGPIRKFCCRQCGECAPEGLLEEGKFLERISWLRHHYAEKHPGMWGTVGRMPETEPVAEYLADSPEYLAQTINESGWREQLDAAFNEAMARVRK